jgi:hypothetical protein
MKNKQVKYDKPVKLSKADLLAEVERIKKKYDSLIFPK